ncbi:MAG: C25 family cysteine peptidase [Pyrinomonadaceae bacterium]
MTPTHHRSLSDPNDKTLPLFQRSALRHRVPAMRRIGFLLALFWVFSLSSTVEAQTTVFTDDFSTNQSATYTTGGAIGASAWSVTRSGADFGARRNTSPAHLELTNDVDATPNANGWVLVNTPSSSFTSPYNTILNANPGVVIWTFNMRQIRLDPAGFAATSYGVAFIVAGTSDTNNNTGSGYAIVLGQVGTTDPIRLARYSGGIQGTLTNIIVSNNGLTDFGTEYLSIKVTYTPSTDTWELFLRNDGGTAFADPAAGSLTSQGTLVDSTSTGTSLPLMGGWWQGSTAANQPAFFDNTTVTVEEPTAVRLTAFAAVQTGDEVVLEWRSGRETRNLGYNIYREQDGKRVAITPSLVAGSALIAGRQTTLSAGLNYTWYDKIGEKAVRGGQTPAGRTSGTVTYWLEDVDLNGTRTLHGPIAPFVQYRRPAPVAPRALLLAEVTQRTRGDGVRLDGYPARFAGQRANYPGLLVSDTDATALQRQIEARPGIKIVVRKTGWYRVMQPELVAAGLDPNVNAPQLQLYTNGRAVPIKQSGDEVHLTSSDYIEFYGHAVDSPTDATQTYYLVIEPEHFGSRIRDLVYRHPKLLPPPSGPTSFEYTIERRERMIYFSGLLNGEVENFFGQVISGTPVSSAMPVDNLDSVSVAAGAPAQLEVSLQGVTNQSHLVRVVVNGTDLGTVSFANTEHATETFAVPAAALANGENIVEFTSLCGAADVSLVDTLRLTYAHRFAADANALAVNIDNGSTRRITGFTSDNIRIVDITTPDNVIEITQTGKVNNEADGTYSVDLQVQGANFRREHTVLLFANDSALSADAVKLNEPSTLWSQTSGADYVMISTTDLKANVEPLAQLRRNQGMVVQVVDVENLYDEFTFGRHSPQAVHDYLARAMNTWARTPHYVLLAGDASYDPKNYLGQGLNDLVPTRLIDTNLTEAASDDLLADFNNDGMADLALGRLPVRTVEDMNALVAKIVGYENAVPNPSRGVLLVADTGFERQSSAVQNLLPSGMTVATINRSSADDETIHSRIISAINQGPRLTNFVGHGSNGVWTGGSVLSSFDAPSLTNTNRLSVFTMMTCFNGYFQDAYNDSLSEALLKAPGGAVAVWASTTLTAPAGQNAIDQEFYRVLFGVQDATLGDAARAAKVVTADVDVRRTWTLFGDPAMRLR